MYTLLGYVQKIRLADPSLGEVNWNGSVMQYPCYTNYKCTPYKIVLTPGKYECEVCGAEGGDHLIGSYVGVGGRGGCVSASFEIKEFMILFASVGGKGSSVGETGDGWVQGGWRGGGKSSRSASLGGAGGGSSDLSLREELATRVIIGGGGGGGNNNCNGGVGGYPKGGNGCGSVPNGGEGGNQTHGGRGCGDGELLNGGIIPQGTESGDHAGGGGGLYGGGRSCHGNNSGGGGSSFAGSQGQFTPFNVSFENGKNLGHGYIRINCVEEWYTRPKNPMTKKCFLAQILMLFQDE